MTELASLKTHLPGVCLSPEMNGKHGPSDCVGSPFCQSVPGLSLIPQTVARERFERSENSVIRTATPSCSSRFKVRAASVYGKRMRGRVATGWRVEGGGTKSQLKTGIGRAAGKSRPVYLFLLSGAVRLPSSLRNAFRGMKGKSLRYTRKGWEIPDSSNLTITAKNTSSSIIIDHAALVSLDLVERIVRRVSGSLLRAQQEKESQVKGLEIVYYDQQIHHRFKPSLGLVL